MRCQLRSQSDQNRVVEERKVKLKKFRFLSVVIDVTLAAREAFVENIQLWLWLWLSLSIFCRVVPWLPLLPIVSRIHDGEEKIRTHEIKTSPRIRRIPSPFPRTVL